MENGIGSLLEEIVGALWELTSTIFESVMEYLPHLLRFMWWCLLGVIVLPCAYIAGNIYPSWVEWGDQL